MPAASPPPPDSPPPDTPPPAPAGGRRLLCGLALAALAPRAAVAWNLTGVCRDAHFYQALAARLREGDLDHGFAYTGLNLFTLLCAGLGAAAESAGVDPLRACVWWGVVCGALTVVPLHDWLRRQFGSAVAVGGCAAFAFHPTVVEVGVEPIREGTFWLLFATALACLHRATAPGVRVGPDGERAPERPAAPVWFLPGGLAAAAATLTRTEGWLLVLPLLGWCGLAVWRRRGARYSSTRLRLAVGAACGLAVGPAALWAVNVTALHAHDSWEWGRPALLADGAGWAGEAAGLDLGGLDLGDGDLGDGDAPPARRPAPAAAPAATGEMTGSLPKTASAPAVPLAALAEPGAWVVAPVATTVVAAPPGATTAGAAGPKPSEADRAAKRLARAEAHAAARAASRARKREKREARREAYAERRRASGKTLAGEPLWWGYLDGLAGAFKPALLVLICAGTWLGRRRLAAADTWPLWAMSATLLSAVALRLYHHGDLNGRYFLLAGLLALPSVGVALAAAWARLAAATWPAAPRFAASFLPKSFLPKSCRPTAAPAWAAAAILAGGHLADAAWQSHPRRDRERAAGRALRASLAGSGTLGADEAPAVWAFGPAANLATAVGGRTRARYTRADPEEAAAARPDLVLLPRAGRRGAAYEPDAEAWRAAGYRPVAPPVGGDPGGELWDRFVALAPAPAAPAPAAQTVPAFDVTRTAAAPAAGGRRETY